jgi:FkbM family methyltransferase
MVKSHLMHMSERLSKIVFLIKSSIYLDLFFILEFGYISLFQKIDFLIKKYYLIILHLFKNFKLGESHINVIGRDFYYDSNLGLSNLQGSLVRNNRELKSLIPNDIKTIFDVGANIGTFSTTAKFIFPDSNIYAFEPIQLTSECLKKNTIEFKDSLKIIHSALSSQNADKIMSFSENESGISRVVNSSEGLKVSAMTLKSFVEKNNIDKIDLLKIDTEGHEFEVLLGSEGFLKNVRYIYMEITLIDNPNYTISKLLSLLVGKGYNFQLVSFRNASDKSYGPIDWMDCLFQNIEYK